LGSHDKAGGLVGYNDGTVTQSYATGTVSGAQQVGGLVGENGSVISFSYATGAVVGTGQDVGGLAGRSRNTGSVRQSYATGPVSGTSTNIAGLIGNNGTGSVTQSYWDTNTTGQGTGCGVTACVGGATGLTTSEFYDVTKFAFTFGTSPLGPSNTCSG